MESLVEVLARPSIPLSLENLEERIARGGEILRLLSHVMEPFRTKGVFFELDVNCRERLGKGICEILSSIESMLVSRAAEASKRLTQCVLFIARLLQFNLGFEGTWPSAIRDLYDILSSVLFRLALVRAHVVYICMKMLRQTDPRIWFIRPRLRGVLVAY